MGRGRWSWHRAVEAGVLSAFRRTRMDHPGAGAEGPALELPLQQKWLLSSAPRVDTCQFCHTVLSPPDAREGRGPAQPHQPVTGHQALGGTSRPALPIPKPLHQSTWSPSAQGFGSARRLVDTGGLHSACSWVLNLPLSPVHTRELSAADVTALNSARGEGSELLVVTEAGST